MKTIPGWKFFLFKWTALPAAGFMGVHLIALDEKSCVTQLKLGWGNKNPFRSIYFAAQTAAAEMATGLPAFLVLREKELAVSMLITGVEASFLQKATGKVHFICEDVNRITEAVMQAGQQSEPVAVEVPVSAIRQSDGVVVAQFKVRWSYKKRQQTN